MAQGRWNRHLGWALLVVGLAGAAWLDPWAINQGDSSFLPSSHQGIGRKAQVGILEMAFLQLALALMISAGVFPPRFRQAVVLSGLGSLVYGGALLLAAWPGAGWFLAGGALANFLALSFLLIQCSPDGKINGLRLILAVFCAGMALDALMGGLAACPLSFFSYLGPEDGVRLRMLRLAQVAVVALPVIALFYQELAQRTDRNDTLVRLGQGGLFVGAVGMPLVLTLAAFTSVRVKYLLPIPALATFLSTVTGLWLAKARARNLEVWGWFLMSLSMATGLFMGLYAFDGPFPAPGFLGSYHDFPRLLSRLVHAYAIVFGMTSIFLARELERGLHIEGSFRLGVPLVVLGSGATLVGVGFLLWPALAEDILRWGPTMTAAGLIITLATSFKSPAPEPWLPVNDPV